MKIVIIQGAFLPIPPVLGGAVEKMWFILGKEFVKKGHQVTYFSRQYGPNREEEWSDGIHHKRIKGYDIPKSGIRLKWLDLLYSVRVKSLVPPDTDVIVTNTFWLPITLSLSLKKKGNG